MAIKKGKFFIMFVYKNRIADGAVKEKKLEDEAKEYLKQGNRDQAMAKIKLIKMEQEGRKRVEVYAQKVGP